MAPVLRKTEYHLGDPGHRRRRHSATATPRKARTPLDSTNDDRQFFASGVEENLDTLYGLALRLTRHAADAEDLVADSVARAWRALDTLTDRERFRPWILRILRNAFISDRRRRAVRPVEVSQTDILGDDADSDLSSLLIEQSDEFLAWWADPEVELANDRLGDTILAAIDRLPEVFRTTIVLVTVENLTYDEAAEVLGVPPGTVRSRMKRGRTLLQKMLWEHGRDAGLVTTKTPSGSTP